MKGWRWAALALGVALLVAVPSAVGALPAGTGPVAPAELLRRMRASDPVPFSAYGESRGALEVPDVSELGSLAQLFGGTTRTRAWWLSPRAWRVDALSLAGEVDRAQDAGGTWVWDSGDRRALRVAGALPVRLPVAADLLAPVLGRRLAGTADVALRPLPARRVAGRAAAGLRLVPRHPAVTTVRRVDLWAEPRTGLPLRVDVTAAGASRPSVSSLLLDLELSRPEPARARFTPPADVHPSVEQAPDLASAIDRFAPFRLPARLGGLTRTDRVRGLSGGGVATYGAGFGAFAVLPLPRGTAYSLERRLAPLGGRIRTPLVHGLLVEAGGRSFLLAGTVPDPVLDRAAADLQARPPVRRDRG